MLAPDGTLSVRTAEGARGLSVRSAAFDGRTGRLVWSASPGALPDRL